MDILKMIGTGVFVVFFFGFCVFIHELGHFLVAKWRGLHVVAFSLGFKKIWGKKIGGVDYRIGCLPFGGYVDLPQIDATGEATDEDGNVLPKVKPIDRILTAFAGPLFNFIFGMFLALFIWQYGVPQDTPKMRTMQVSAVPVESPEYQAGLRKGDIITQINGENYYGPWSTVVKDILMTIGDISLTIQRDNKEQVITYAPKANPDFRSGKYFYPFFRIKIPKILYPKPNSPAEKAGIMPGDELVELDGKSVDSLDWILLRRAFHSTSQKTYNLKVSRKNKVIPITVNSQRNDKVPEKYVIDAAYTPTKELYITDLKKKPLLEKLGFKENDILLSINNKNIVNENQELLYDAIKTGLKNKDYSFLVQRNNEMCKIDVQQKDFMLLSQDNQFVLSVSKKGILIQEIIANGPAQKAGLKVKDIISHVNGKELLFNNFANIIKSSEGKVLNLTVVRDLKNIDIQMTPKLAGSYGLGISLTTYNYPNPIQQFTDVAVMSYKSLRGIFAGLGKKVGLTKNGSSLSPSDLSGPLGIIDIISTVVYRGSILLGINFIVMITFSLGILNLMPVPVLDGGHITLACIEIIFRRPLHTQVVKVLSLTFATLLISFMLFVTFHDGKRFIEKFESDKLELIFQFEQNK